ncbi:unnamed protein product [Leptidea sinapis]|uniref:Aldehyde dehydrogenase domain-containing protein n=1 Tax=Leptidea sinapis TaxID=189913 RepID=A0A5E4QNM1_9NEOP|nr:unnamed protein product [Leptidea sinapis]
MGHKETRPRGSLRPQNRTRATDGHRDGRVQQILKFSSLEEVVQRANDTEYGLAAAVVCAPARCGLTITTCSGTRCPSEGSSSRGWAARTDPTASPTTPR